MEHGKSDPLPYLLAKDMRSDLHDRINTMDPYFRQNPLVKVMFEAMIDECRHAEEPGAPAIKIYNHEDTDPCPDWEFLYTNQMWYGEGVPGPDRTSLRSCSCIGKCDPATCKCAVKARPFTEGQTKFMYDQNGCLYDIPGYPIFECNSWCGCDEDCPNRVGVLLASMEAIDVLLPQVVQRGRRYSVNIVKTKEKGWGKLPVC